MRAFCWGMEDFADPYNELRIVVFVVPDANYFCEARFGIDERYLSTCERVDGRGTNGALVLAKNNTNRLENKGWGIWIGVQEFEVQEGVEDRVNAIAAMTAVLEADAIVTAHT